MTVALPQSLLTRLHAAAFALRSESKLAHIVADGIEMKLAALERANGRFSEVAPPLKAGRPKRMMDAQIARA